jgi:hypothetical protein
MESLINQVLLAYRYGNPIFDKFIIETKFAFNGFQVLFPYNIFKLEVFDPNNDELIVPEVNKDAFPFAKTAL